MYIVAHESKTGKLATPQEKFCEWAEKFAKLGYHHMSDDDPDSFGAIVRIGDDYWDISRYRFDNNGTVDWSTVITRLMVGADNGVVLGSYKITLLADEVAVVHEKAEDPASSTSPNFVVERDILNGVDAARLLDIFEDKVIGVVPPQEALAIYKSHHKAEKREFRRVRAKFPQETNIEESAQLMAKKGLMSRVLKLKR